MSDRKREREFLRETRRIDDRITGLEHQLGAARRRVAELADEGDPPNPKLERTRIALIRAGHDGSSARKLLGAPMLLRMRRRFDGVFPTDRFDRVVARIREVTEDPGFVETGRESLVWASSPQRHPIQPHFMVRLTIAEAGPAKLPEPEDHRDQFTTLTVTDRLEEIVGRLFGGFGVILGAGGLAAPLAASIAMPVFAPVFVLGWLGGVFGTTRVLYRRIAGGRAKVLQHLFGQLVEEIEPHIRRGDA